MNVKHLALIALIFLIVSPVFATTEPNFVRQGTIASAQSSPNYVTWNAIDRKPATDWWSGGSAYPIWYQFDYGSGNTSYIESYEMTHYAGAGYYWDTWVVQGTNNNASWSAILDYRTGESFVAGTSKKYFFRPEYAANKSDYRFYRILGFKGTNDPQFTEFYLYNEGNTSVDTTPPTSITNLQNTTTCENVTFTWNNPLDSDYSHLYNLWDNVPGTNLTNATTSKAFTPATVGTHTFSTKTVDLKGNINATWVNMSVSITACPTPTPTPTPSFTITPAPPTEGAQWCGLQDIFFQHDGSDIAGYENWINYPSGNTEVDESVTLTNSSWVLIDSYATPPNLPNINLIQAGLRTYYLYAYVSTTAGTNTLNVTVFKRNISGGETRLYSVETGDIEAATTTLYTIPYASATNLTLDATDRLVAKVYAKKTTAGDVTIHWVYQGTSHASYVRSGFFVCAPSACCVSTTTPQGTAAPYVMNPTTDKKTDWLKLVWDWWWLPALILFMIWLFGGRR